MNLRAASSVAFFAVLVSSCSSSSSEPLSCITSFDCPVGQVCGEDGFCTDPIGGNVEKDAVSRDEDETRDFDTEEGTELDLAEPEEYGGDEETEAGEESDEAIFPLDESVDNEPDDGASDNYEGVPDTGQDGADVAPDQEVMQPDFMGDTSQPDSDATQPDLTGDDGQPVLDLDVVQPDPDATLDNDTAQPDNDSTQPDPDATPDNDVPVTRTFTCADKPANSVWNTVSSYQQTWNGSAWVPADSPTVYDETPTTTACHFVCVPDFSWNGTQCVAIPHECSSNLDCTSDANRRVCDTTVSPRKCVMCLQNSDCHAQYGEQCDIGSRQCWAGFTCQHAIWMLPHWGFYDWEDGLQGWQETTNFWSRRTSSYYTPAQSGSYSFGYLHSAYCDPEYGYGCYGANWDETARLGAAYDMSPCGSCTVQVSFYYTGRTEYNEYGDSPDPFHVRCSGNGGASWEDGSNLSPYYYYDSEYGSWNWGWHQWNLPAQCLTDTFTLGLRFSSNSWNNEVGVVVDDLSVSHPAGNLPKGAFDAVTNGPGSVLWGWTCDADNYSVPLLVQIAFYRQGNLNTSPVVKWLRAAVLREEAVGTQCGGDRYHGFYYALEESIVAALGPGTHTAYAWAVNIPSAGWGSLCGGHFKQVGNAKQFTLP